MNSQASSLERAKNACPSAGSEVPFTAFILAEGAGKKKAPLHVSNNLLSNIIGALTKSIHVVRAYNNASEHQLTCAVKNAFVKALPEVYTSTPRPSHMP